MARTKPTAATVLRDWQEVDESLRELGDITRRVDVHEAKVNARIDELKAKLAEATADDLARKARLEVDIKDFTIANAEAMPGRSRKLNFGTVFLRRTSALKTLPKLTWAKVLEIVKRSTRREFIRTKEEIDKEAVQAAKLPPEDLEQLGMRMVEGNSFTYELAETEAQSTC